MVVDMHTTSNTVQAILKRTIPTHLSGQSTLKADPLSVNVIVALKLGTVSLDTRFRANNDRLKRHQYVPPSMGSSPNAIWAADVLAAVNTALPMVVAPKFVRAPLAVVAPVPP
jgi:hypothetical protein